MHHDISCGRQKRFMITTGFEPATLAPRSSFFQNFLLVSPGTPSFHQKIVFRVLSTFQRHIKNERFTLLSVGTWREVALYIIRFFLPLKICAQCFVRKSVHGYRKQSSLSLSLSLSLSVNKKNLTVSSREICVRLNFAMTRSMIFWQCVLVNCPACIPRRKK